MTRAKNKQGNRIQKNVSLYLNNIEKGEKFYKAGKFDDAIKCYDEEIKKNPKNTEALNYKGLCLLEKKDFDNALSCFSLALKLDSTRSLVWNCLGTHSFYQNKIDDASKFYNKALDLDENTLSYSNLAYLHYYLGQYKIAISYTEKALKMDCKFVECWNIQGLIFTQLELYDKAIQCFNQIVNDLNKDFYPAWNNLGHVYTIINKIGQAKECLDTANSINELYAPTWNNIGVLYATKGDWITAWEFFDKASKIDSKFRKCWENKAICLFELLVKYNNLDFGTFKDVGSSFSKSEKSIIDVIIALDESESSIKEQEKEEILSAMIFEDNFFNQTTEGSTISKEIYKQIYLYSLKVIALLNVNKIEELRVAHYTKKDVVNSLIFEESPFRLNTITTANDPKEGLPLLTYLGFQGNFITPKYQAFIGSFIFNPDSLNQFRLYGKEKNIEGTGLSISVSYEYFSDDVTINGSLINSLDSNLGHSNRKESLFRCIYIDPLTKQVISIGHKEPCVLYRELIADKNIDRTIGLYTHEIETIKHNVKNGLEQLNNIISELFSNLETNSVERKEAIKIIPILLTHLRYLVKHSDFKEEQECRIIKVEPLRDNNKIIVSNDGSRMFINYLPMHNKQNNDCFIKDLYWGPKASDFELLRDRIEHYGLDIWCHKTDHPFN